MAGLRQNRQSEIVPVPAGVAAVESVMDTNDCIAERKRSKRGRLPPADLLILSNSRSNRRRIGVGRKLVIARRREAGKMFAHLEVH